MFRNFFHRFKTFFELDRRQAKIHFVLLWVTMLVLCSPVFTYYTYPLLSPADNYSVSIDTSFQTQDVTEFTASKEIPFHFKKHIAQFSAEDWIAAGVPEYLAKRILKYQSKGAVLHTIHDLSKVYGMNETLLQNVKPFVLEDVSEGSVKKQMLDRKPKPLSQKQEMIDINTVDSNTLILLPGIGPVFARRIIQYRMLLKGYVSKTQFKEVYGLSEFALEVLEKKTFVKSIPLASLAACDYAKLNEHLYLSSKDARYVMSELKKNNTLCWDDLQSGLEVKAQSHVEDLKLYYPCE